MRRANDKFDLHLIFPLALALAAPAALAGQQVEARTLPPLQPGTTLPVVLGHALYAGKAVAGARILATTTQRVPIGAHAYLKRGAELIGEVTASVASGGADPAQSDTLSIRFTTLRYRGQTVSLAADAIAIANFTDVDETAQPTDQADRGIANPADWNTVQIGGDEVYRSGWVGSVRNSAAMQVGFSDSNGVYSLPPDHGNGPDFPLAMGVFSTTATGLYGFDDGVALHSAQGVITLTGPRKKVFVRRGDNLLLRVVEGR